MLSFGELAPPSTVQPTRSPAEALILWALARACLHRIPYSTSHNCRGTGRAAYACPRRLRPHSPHPPQAAPNETSTRSQQSEQMTITRRLLMITWHYTLPRLSERVKLRIVLGNRRHFFSPATILPCKRGKTHDHPFGRHPLCATRRPCSGTVRTSR